MIVLQPTSGSDVDPMLMMTVGLGASARALLVRQP
jgi:hypothetical protein